MGITRRTSPHARRLRRDMTDAERNLWFVLRGRRFAGRKFRRQSSIGPYIADFVCLAETLVVEVDGGQHSDVVDARRTGFLEAQGFRVIRFWNNEVLCNLDGVLMRISDALESRRPPSSNFS